jgi:bacteriocin-like protein
MTIERQPDTGALEELSMDELAQVAGGSSLGGSDDENDLTGDAGVPNPPGDHKKYG